MGDTNSDFQAVPDAAGLEPGVKLTKREPHPHAERPTCVAATSDGRVVTCDDKGSVYVWSPDLASKTELKTPGAAKASYVAVSKNGRVLTAFFDGTVTVSDLHGGKPTVFDGHRARTGPKTEVWAVAVSSDGTRALSATNGGEIRYWNVDTGSTIAAADGDEDAVAALAFLPGDKGFLSGHSDGRIIPWTITPAYVLTPGTEFPRVNAAGVNSICVFTDGGGAKAITGSLDGEVRVWDQIPPSAKDGTPRTLPVKHRHFVWRVAASPDGRTFASVGQDEKVNVFDGNGTPLPKVQIGDEKDGVMGVTFVSNTRVVYTTGGLKDQVKGKDL